MSNNEDGRMMEWEERQRHQERLGGNYDFAAALNYNGKCEVLTLTESILLEITGENDGPQWHWLTKLHDGRFAYVSGGCDYTGWDCQGWCDVHCADTREAAMLLVPQDERRIFEEMVAAGETVRKAPVR